MKLPSIKLTPFSISLIYVLLGCVWILFSDLLLNAIAGTAEAGRMLQTGKGLLYVAATGGLLYLLVRRVITVVQRSHHALQESEHKFRVLTENTSSGIFIYNGRFLYSNPSMEVLTGYKTEELSKKDMYDILHEDFHEEAKTYWDAVLNGEVKSCSAEMKIVLNGVGTRWVEMQCSSIQFKGERALLVTMHDISERKAAENALLAVNAQLENKISDRTKELTTANERLRELDKLKSLFIATTTHELRTPLNSIIGFSSLLSTGSAGPLNPDQQDMIGKVIRSAQHLLDLVNDVIDVLKIETGKIEPHIEDFDLAALIAEAVDFFSKEASDKGLTIDTAAESVSLHSDRRRLLQALLNLLGNAVKFTDKGKIAVRTIFYAGNGGSGCDRVEISVEDTGIGIKEEDKQHLFSPFGRIASEATRNVYGTGLGLYLTQKLVSEVLKGETTLQSTYGEGSTFTIAIPARISLNTVQQGS